MDTTARRQFGGVHPKVAGMRRVPPHNHLLNWVGIGEAVMLAPFFGVGHGLAVVSGAEQTGFSWPYQLFAFLGGLVYVLLGLALVGSVLRRWFRSSTIVITLLAITFGTDLFHYATYDAVFSHGFSFFLVAAALRLAISVWERPRLSVTVGLGAVMGLVPLVRPTNLVVLLPCGLIGVKSVGDLRARCVAILNRLDLLAVGVATFSVVVVPQLAYWYSITGRIVVYSYPSDQRLDLLHPHLLDVLFGVRKGLFFWTPLLLLAVAGLPFLWRLAPPLSVPAVVYLVVDAWVIASWSFWWYGGSFGMRPFVEAMPVFALGLAALIEAARGALARRAVRIAIALTTLLAVHAMLAYWTGAVPLDGTTWQRYLDSFNHL